MKRFSMISLLLALSVALAALAAACGGGGSSSTTSTTAAQPASDWAEGVCSAMVTWTDSLKTAAGQVKGNVSKDSLSSAADDMKSATSTFVDNIKALGPPDTQSGQQAKQDVDQLADQLSADVDTIKQALSSGNLVNAATTLGSTATKMGNDVQSTFNKLQQLDAKGELKTAFQNAPSCKKLGVSAS